MTVVVRHCVIVAVCNSDVVYVYECTCKVHVWWCWSYLVGLAVNQQLLVLYFRFLNFLLELLELAWIRITL